MAQTSETQASGPLFGELEALFGEIGPPKRFDIDKPTTQLNTNITSDISSALQSLGPGLRQYRRQIGLNNPLLRNATLESDKVLSDTYRRQSPLQDLFGVGDYLSGQFKSMVAPYIDPIANSIYNRTTIGNMARGVGGTPAGSSYGDLLRGRILGQTAADYGSKMMGMLPSLYPQLQGANQARFSELLNVLPARRSGFEELEQRRLNPYMANVAGLQDIIGLNAGNIGNIRNNLGGWMPDQGNWANRLGGAGRATTANINQLFDWAQQAASIYGSVMGGGMGGGMSGGGLSSLFGGGGGQQSSNPMGSAQAHTAATAQSVGPTYFPNYQQPQPQPYGTNYNPHTDTSDYFYGNQNPYSNQSPLPSSGFYPS